MGLWGRRPEVELSATEQAQLVDQVLFSLENQKRAVEVRSEIEIGGAYALVEGFVRQERGQVSFETFIRLCYALAVAVVQGTSNKRLYEGIPGGKLGFLATLVGRNALAAEPEELLELIASRGIPIENHDLALVIAFERRNQEYRAFAERLRSMSTGEEVSLETLLDQYVSLVGANEPFYRPLLRQYLEFMGKTTSQILDFEVGEAVARVRRKMYEETLLGINSPVLVEASGTSAGRDFENWLQALFRRLGFEVSITPASTDFGADLIVERLGERIAVQAKWSSSPVGNHAIMEAVASIKYYGCSSAIVATNGTFTVPARQLAASNGVELWAGEKLAGLAMESGITWPPF